MMFNKNNLKIRRSYTTTQRDLRHGVRMLSKGDDVECRSQNIHIIIDRPQQNDEGGKLERHDTRILGGVRPTYHHHHHHSWVASLGTPLSPVPSRLEGILAHNSQSHQILFLFLFIHGSFLWRQEKRMGVVGCWVRWPYGLFCGRNHM